MSRVKKPTLPRRGKKERILALDVSSVCVGFAVFDHGRLVYYGKYHQVGAEHGEKLRHFETWLEELLERATPDHVAVEAPYAGRRRYAFAVLMMYLGVVLLVHHRYFGIELPVDDKIAASSVKRVLKVPKGKDHNERKRLMLEEINRLYGLSLKFKPSDRTKKVSDDDTADAIAVGRAWLIRCRPAQVYEE